MRSAQCVMVVAAHNSYRAAKFYKRSIGALPNDVRPFLHYALRTSHYALKNGLQRKCRKPFL